MLVQKTTSAAVVFNHEISQTERNTCQVQKVGRFLQQFVDHMLRGGRENGSIQDQIVELESDVGPCLGVICFGPRNFSARGS